MMYEIKQEAVRSGQSINRGEEIEQDHGNQFKPSKQMTVNSLSLSSSSSIKILQVPLQEDPRGFSHRFPSPPEFSPWALRILK
jgi:hypothetical protein